MLCEKKKRKEIFDTHSCKCVHLKSSNCPVLQINQTAFKLTLARDDETVYLHLATLERFCSLRSRRTDANSELKRRFTHFCTQRQIVDDFLHDHARPPRATRKFSSAALSLIFPPTTTARRALARENF